MFNKDLLVSRGNHLFLHLRLPLSLLLLQVSLQVGINRDFVLCQCCFFICGSDVLTIMYFFSSCTIRSSSRGEGLCSIKAFCCSFRYLLISFRTVSVLIPSAFFLVWTLVSSFLKSPPRRNHLAKQKCLHHLLLLRSKLRLL